MQSTIRSLRKNALYSVLNMAGLTIGMASAMLIALWVQHEYRFDQYHRHAAQICRIKANLRANDHQTISLGTTPLRIKDACAQVTGIESTAQLLALDHNQIVLNHNGQLTETALFAFADEHWMQLFDYTPVAGTVESFGHRPDGLVMTRSLSKRIFGHDQAAGQTIRIDTVWYTVLAVVEDPVASSSFRQELLLPMSARLSNAATRDMDYSWNYFNFNTFIQLREGASPTETARQLSAQVAAASGDSTVSLSLAPLADLHFDHTVREDIFEKGNLQSVRLFSLVGLFILLMAVGNYIGLNTARTHTRAREAAIHKIVGASKGQLFRMFMQESVVLVLVSGILAAGLVQYAMPWFSALAGRAYSLNWYSALPWTLLCGTSAATIALAGIYPAILMAGIRPLQLMRRQTASGKQSIRQVVVVAQFAVAVVLLVSTIVIARQRSFIRQKDMGYDREQVFTFTINWQQYRSLGPERAQSLLQALHHDLAQSAAVAGVCRANESPVHIQSTHNGNIRFEGAPDNLRPVVTQLAADDQFVSVFGLNMADGRWFDANQAADANHVVLNETAARQLGLPKPWVGQRFGFHGKEGQVIGIVRDFHFLPLHQAIAPLVIYSDPANWKGYCFVKTRPGQTTQALAAAQTIWANYFPDRPFSYTFLADHFDQLYRAEQQSGVLFNLFAVIAMGIACLGLFGLVTFAAARRTREVGIRKVLGASVASVAALLTKDFLKLVVLAVVLAIPVAWYLMQQWLSDFAYRIELEWWVFVLAGGIATTTAVLTVSFQSIRAALADPVKSLEND